MTEREKAAAGLPYQPWEPALRAERQRAGELCFAVNQLPPGELARREALLRELLGAMGADCRLVPPVHFDYGYNTRVGDGFYSNCGLTVLDCAAVTIGDRVLIGPNVGIYTALHPLDAAERATGLETARPVTIGSDVWIGGGVTILPGVTIGDRAVIGAGSVVTRDVPAGVLAAGNPCRPIRALEPGGET